jgi:hypothetical protein
MARLPTFAFTLALSSGIGLVMPLGAGCDDDGTGGSDACTTELDAESCFDYGCFTAGPTRSFRTDVLPLFERSCSLAASCHGTPTSPTGPSGYQPYLGEVNPETTPSDVDLILMTIVGQDSHAASMKIVDPGKPETSFLMHKMDGDLECASVTCSGGCGTIMPQGSDVLPRAERDIVRDWILQGAQNN